MSSTSFEPRRRGRGNGRRCFRRIGLVAPILFALSGLPTMPASGQATSDFDDQGKPVSTDGDRERYGAHAACDSPVLAENGWTVVKQVPDRRDECFWARPDEEVRPAPPPAGTVAMPPKLPNYLKFAKTPTEAVRQANQMYETKLLFVRQQEAEAATWYAAVANRCGSDDKCVDQAQQTLAMRNDRLVKESQKAAAELLADKEIIRRHYSIPMEAWLDRYDR